MFPFDYGSSSPKKHDISVVLSDKDGNMGIRMSGKEVSLSLRENIKKRCEELKNKHGITPCLAVILVGENPASVTYVSNKMKACEELGFEHRDYSLDVNVSQEKLLSIIDYLNEAPSVHGILVQLPLPSHIEENAVIRRIKPEKDVDGFHPMNAGLLLQGNPVFIPCTPKGILELLKYYNIETDGKRVCVIGRSNIVGKPIATLLMQKGWDATVTECNTHTKDLKEITLASDIVIVATGCVHTLTADMVKEGATVIDVGVNRVEDPTRERGWRLTGDTDYNEILPKAYAATPVPGGVGVMTITMLMENTMLAAERAAKKAEF